MKKSEKNSKKITIETLCKPYHQSPSDTLGDYYVRYINDESRTMVKDGMTYYKALSIERITAKETFLIVALPAEIIKDAVSSFVDENGAKYKYKGIERLSFQPPIPAWYNRIVFLMLEYSDECIGDYFAVLN